MPFRFPLQSLLRFRQSVERHEQTQLEIANLKVADMRGKIESLDQSRDLRNESQRHGLKAGLTGAELQFDLLCRHALASYRSDLNKKLAHLEKRRDEQYEVFRSARLQREILESVRDGQLREYRAQKIRRNQRSIDDLILMRREFVRRER
jgi:flagellar export protein FliJ